MKIKYFLPMVKIVYFFHSKIIPPPISRFPQSSSSPSSSCRKSGPQSEALAFVALFPPRMKFLHCIRAPPRQGMDWEIHPRRPRFLEGRGKSREISRGRGVQNP